jgi:hypothetical protein
MTTTTLNENKEQRKEDSTLPEAVTTSRSTLLTSAASTPIGGQVSAVEVCSATKRGVRKSSCSVRRKRQKSKMVTEQLELQPDYCSGQKEQEDEEEEAEVSSSKCGREVFAVFKCGTTKTHRWDRRDRRDRQQQQRRTTEDHLAMIFMGIILLFLVCHLPRILLGFHEIATIHRSAFCQKAGLRPSSKWSLLTISVSHFLLVLNSATNMIVYGLFSPKFRKECGRTWKRMRQRIQTSAPDVTGTGTAHGATLTA